MAEFLLRLDEIFVASRGRKDYGDLAPLGASLKEHGQLQNIVVRPPNPGEDTEGRKWVLVAGGRRYAAAILVGFEPLRAISIEELPEWRQKALELEENVQRLNMSWQEEADLRLQIHELYSANNPGWQQNDTAKLFKESAATIARDLKVAKAIREDPTLAQASSRKQAARLVDMREFTKAQELAVKTVDWSRLRKSLVVGDMRDYLRGLPTASVDLLFSDLPYGIEYFDLPTGTNISEGGGASKFDDSWESIVDLYFDIVPEIARVVKNTGWIALMSSFEGCELLRQIFRDTCVAHFDLRQENLAVCQSHQKDPKRSCIFPLVPEPKHWIWYRPNSKNNSQFPDRHAANDYENILIVNAGDARIYTCDQYRTGNVIVADVDNTKDHPHQKPEILCDEIIRRLTLPGQLIVDICYGSGSALVSAARLGRQWAGCDSNPVNQDIALARISKYSSGKEVA